MEKKDEEILRAMIGKNADHYLAKFAQIERGEKTKFQWSSFWLGGLFILYRRCNELFKKYYLAPMILWIAITVVPGLVLKLSGGLIYSDLDLYMSLAGISTGFVYIMSRVVGVWMLIVSIVLGKRFPQLYLEHLLRLKEKENIVDVEQNRMIIDKIAGTSMKGPLIIIVILIAIEFAVEVVVAL